MKAVICSTKCKGCGRCVAACSTGAVTIENGTATVNYALCEGCGACIDVCRSRAVYLEMKSSDLTRRHPQTI